MSFWNDERVEKMYELYSKNGEDLSARETGAILGCTRNAVIGKFNREFPSEPQDTSNWTKAHTEQLLELYIPGVVSMRKVGETMTQWGYRWLLTRYHQIPADHRAKAMRRRRNPSKKPKVREVQEVPKISGISQIPKMTFLTNCCIRGCPHTRQGGRVLCAKHITEEYLARVPA